MADNTLLSASTGTGDLIRTVHKSTYKTPVSLIDVGGTSTGTESILGDSTHLLPVKVVNFSTPLSVSGSTINVNVVSISGTTSQAVTLTTASTLSVNVSNTVGVSVTTASSMHADTELPAAAALADNAVNPTAPAVGSFPHLWDGAGWDRWPGSSALGGKVEVTGISGTTPQAVTVTTASTLSVNVSNTVTISPLTTGSTVHAAQSGTWTIAALTTASTIHANVSGSSVSISPLTTASTINVVITSGGGGTQYAIGTTGSTGDTATIAGAYRKDTPAALADTTGDVTGLQVDSEGKLWTNVSRSTVAISPLTTATTINVVITAGGGTGGTAVADNSVFVPTSGLGTPMFGIVSVTTVTTGSVGAIGMLSNRQIKATLFDSAGVEQAIGGGTQYVIGTSGSTGNTGTVALGYRKDTAATLVDTTGKVTAPIFDASGQMWVNASGSTIPVTLTTGSTVSINGTVTEANSGTIATALGVGAAALRKVIGAAASTVDHAVAVVGVRDDSLAAYAGTDGDYEPFHTDANGAIWVHPIAASTISVNVVSISGTTPQAVTLTTASTVSVNGTVSVNALTTASTIHIAPLTLASTINVIAVAGTSGGCSIFNKLGTTVYESTTVKTSPGQVYGISGYNNTLNPIFVKLYNTTAAPTTALTALWRGIIPATTVTGAAGFVEDYACPVSFSTGIGIKITGGSLTDGDTAIAATSASLYTVNLRYA